MSTPNDTLRARLEAIRDRDLDSAYATVLADREDALAALRILNSEDVVSRHLWESERLARNAYRERWVDAERRLAALVPDPGGRAAARPTTREDASESAGSSSTTSRITHE